MKIAPLIKLRENSRDQQRRALHEAELYEDALRARIGEIEFRLSRNLSDWRLTGLRQPVPLEELRLLETQRQELNRLKDEAQKRLAEAVEATEKARGALSEAVQNVRVLENLRDRKESEMAAAAKKVEQKNLDQRSF
ncbi:MAG: flagellar FliJ family protein [Thermoguttaceae bacterium]|nr:flagellar FliJ family protein [Thermoguttaceae bacterium]